VFAKPIVVVDVDGYYAPLIALLENVTKKGFARPEILKLHHLVTSPDDAIATLNRLLASQVEA
jgi:predicted Rossmann-fold nucleotide-binding protein